MLVYRDPGVIYTVKIGLDKFHTSAAHGKAYIRVHKSAKASYNSMCCFCREMPNLHTYIAVFDGLYTWIVLYMLTWRYRIAPYFRGTKFSRMKDADSVSRTPNRM